MKITALVTQGSGSHWHRIVNPMEYMPWQEGDVHNMLWMGIEESQIACDILFYSKYTYTPIEVIRQMQKAGMKTVVDMDDMWHLSPDHPSYYTWQQGKVGENIEEHIKTADLVICTSMLLQDKVREINKNTVVIPNALPYGQLNYKPDPKSHNKMTFMYMGGATHYNDIKLLEGKFRRIGSDNWIKDRAEFILAGYDKSKQKKFYTNEDRAADNNNYITEDVTWGEYDKMSTVFSHTGSYRVLPSIPLWDYIDYYDHADVALVPLVLNSWNKYKSELKLVECAAKEIPAIVSKVEPYWPELKDCPGIMWVDTDKNWLNWIKYCIKNPQQVKEMGKQLSEYIRERYGLMEWNQVRYDVIKSLL